MPTIDIEENIQRIRNEMETKSQEILRLEGMLKIFDGFKKGGLTTIKLPNDPGNPSQESVEELESIQEKPE